MTMQRMELLAPAGGREQLKAALRFGADAVYGGLSRHSLRAFAGNFDAAALSEAVRLCHAQGARFYAAINALATDGGECLVRLKNRFYVGDALEVLTPEGPRAFTVSRMTLDTTGESVQTASVAGTLLRMPIPGGAGAGDLLRGPCRNHRSL